MKHNQRTEARVDVNLPLYVQQICFAGNNRLKLNKVLPVRMINLSASGVKIYSPLDLPVYLKLFINLYIEDKILPGYIEIIRKEKNDAGFSYGCRLYTSLYKDKMLIRKYVWKLVNHEAPLRKPI